ncbi:uncharacterized protein LOC106673752 isoform X2 [Cimex lectularius]|uniref:Uncharacterized protein n=1 Tax=Cimex lectularius TaxID=79782 RepID=A0A8I6S9H4_CIMLE|nr:uncharacterized protein LOC106673752 isoform X2 [Cimex lectularius]XP_014261450.1 uncharacterized protein LOC106673752 isoform X2 [Cimex lectularius]
MDQIDMDSLPDYEGILRKFIFYIYLSYYCGYYSPMLLFGWFKLSSGAVIAVTSTFYILHLICTLLLIIDCFGIYIAPSDKDVLTTCLALTLKHKLNLFTINGPKLTEEIVMTVKLLTLLGTVSWVSLEKVIGDLVGKSILDSMDTEYNVVIFFTVMFLITTFIACVLELVFQPFLRNETPLKTPFHYIAIATVIFVGAMVLRGFYLHGRELEQISQPRLRGHCQLRFFNSLSDEVSIKVRSYSYIKIKPYGAAFFLKIPTRLAIKVLITTNHSSFSLDLHVLELYSYSYIVHSDRITEELEQSPIRDKWKLRSDTAYFFLLDSKLAKVLTFYKEGKLSKTYNMSERQRIYAIPPGIYAVHIKTNSSETTTNAKWLKPGFVYCLFIHLIQNDTSAIEGKFFFNTMKSDENYYALGVQGLMFSVGHMTMFVTIMFYVQTESSVSSKGTVFTWTMILFHLADKIMHGKKAIFSNATSLTYYTTAFFLAAFIIVSINAALRYKFTEYSLK